MLTYIQAMDFVEGESKERSNILTHSIVGLAKENLIDDDYQYGSAEHLKKKYPLAESAGTILQPSPLGIELFLWAYGLGKNSLAVFLRDETKFELDSTIQLIKDYKRLQEKKGSDAG